MNESDRELLEEALTLSKENNRILKNLQHAQRLSVLWGVIKVVILVLPFVLGYFYLKPYFGDLGSVGSNFSSIKDVLNAYK